MKFVADAMLGTLARRLRLLGYDVAYSPSFSDNEIIGISLEQDRTILTRDTGLAARPLARRHLFIESGHPDDQVRQVLEGVPPIDRPTALTRCSACNGRLAAIGKKDVVDRVPPHISRTIQSFMRCNVCGKIYWQGSHARNIGWEGQKTTGSGSGTGCVKGPRDRDEELK